MTRVYLDNCCFNRPFDDQSSIRVKLETDAKLYVQQMIRTGEIEFVWSYIIDFENEANPFAERKSTISKWKSLAIADISETDTVLINATMFVRDGIKTKDALHLACAIEAKCQYFLTTDDILLKKMSGKRDIFALNPTDFIKSIE